VSGYENVRKIMRAEHDLTEGKKATRDKGWNGRHPLFGRFQ
jgi:hypothetical protein